MKSFKVHTVDRTKIKKWMVEGKPTIISKYADVSSDSQEGVVYQVVKYRKGFIVGPTAQVSRYACTCKGFMFRLKACKHIVAFRKAENKG